MNASGGGDDAEPERDPEGQLELRAAPNAATEPEVLPQRQPSLSTGGSGTLATGGPPGHKARSLRDAHRDLLTEAVASIKDVSDVGFLDDELAKDRFKDAINVAIEVYAKQRELDRVLTDVPELKLSTLVPYLVEPVESIADDDFNKCFESLESEPWNWTLYMYPAWLVGCFIRYVVLFPARLFNLIFATVLTVIAVASCKILFAGNKQKREHVEGLILTLYAQAWVASWSGVVKYHGTRPRMAANQIYVANHSSMIDYILLLGVHRFAVVGQLHPGGVGLMQTHLLGSLGCIWFDRKNVKDRDYVRKSIAEHVARADKPPLLIFPEGTCVNNEYCVMFKKGAFDIDATVHPVAIKYNKLFADAFWNSRQESFFAHVLRMMKDWCLIADVWFLEPQTKRPGESSEAFAARVKQLIAKQAGLKCVSFDGYLKHVKPSERYRAAIQTQNSRFFRAELQDMRGYLKDDESKRNSVLWKREQRNHFLRALNQDERKT